MPDQDAIHAFFETDAYLKKNPIIPVRTRLVSELLANVADARILDLGCGDGSISLPLLRGNNSLTLVDFSAAMLDRARAAAPLGAAVEFIRADVTDYVPTDPYDVVLCVGVLSHVPSVERLIACAADALRARGLCVIQMSDDAQPIGRIRKRYYRVRYPGRGGRNEMALAGLVGLASQHQLDVRAVRRYGLDLPGSGCLPYAWQRQLEAATVSSPALSRFSAELVACFQKASATAKRA